MSSYNVVNWLSDPITKEFFLRVSKEISINKDSLACGCTLRDPDKIISNTSKLVGINEALTVMLEKIIETMKEEREKKDD